MKLRSILLVLLPITFMGCATPEEPPRASLTDLIRAGRFGSGTTAILIPKDGATVTHEQLFIDQTESLPVAPLVEECDYACMVRKGEAPTPGMLQQSQPGFQFNTVIIDGVQIRP